MKLLNAYIVSFNTYLYTSQDEIASRETLIQLIEREMFFSYIFMHFKACFHVNIPTFISSFTHVGNLRFPQRQVN